jgi:hypothetical protein
MASIGIEIWRLEIGGDTIRDGDFKIPDNPKENLWNGQGYHLLAMLLRCVKCCRLLYKKSEKLSETLL